MKKVLGSLFSIGGLIALLITGYHYIHESSSLHAFGSTITIHNASVWPLVISGIVFILGIVVLAGSRGR
ncbi:MAG TPA: hypothetical protein VKA08_18390 [Balneolales bacterium]|nr:hypothetical protein [Balneolales bacterium]